MIRNKSLYRVLLTLLLSLVANNCYGVDPSPYAGDQKNNEENKTEWISSDKVIIQGRDITGNVFSAEVKIGKKVVFGELELYIKKALHSAPEESEESIAYVEIYENKVGEARRLIFYGWFIASDPALNPFDHPCYDLWLKETVVPKEVPPAPEVVEEKDAKKAEASEEEIND